jgi:hypothetical protein
MDKYMKKEKKQCLNHIDDEVKKEFRNEILWIGYFKKHN